MKSGVSRLLPPKTLTWLLAMLLAVLATLQYRWTGEISLAEHQRLRAGLDESAKQFAEYLRSAMSRTLMAKIGYFFARQAFRALKAAGHQVTPSRLKEETREMAEGQGQLALFELMYEEAPDAIDDEASVLALYDGQWKAFSKARADALENTRIYLSACNDLDVYVATSMRTRGDFREMATTCDRIFSASELAPYNIRYFDPTLSAAQHHEDKGLIECLMVKTAKLLLYFAQHRESLGKVSEYAMALSQGKPVIVLCPEDARGRELYKFYRDAHPLMRLVHFDTGIVNGAMITHNVDVAIELLARFLSARMEYDLDRKPGTERYYLLKERLTGSTVRIVTDDRLLTETFWNNWQGIS